VPLRAKHFTKPASELNLTKAFPLKSLTWFKSPQGVNKVQRLSSIVSKDKLPTNASQIYIPVLVMVGAYVPGATTSPAYSTSI